MAKKQVTTVELFIDQRRIVDRVRMAKAAASGMATPPSLAQAIREGLDLWVEQNRHYAEELGISLETEGNGHRQQLE